MTTTESLYEQVDMITVGTVPLNPAAYTDPDAKGKIVLFVRDGEDGRSAFMGVEMYGQLDRLYEVNYDDWAKTITRMTGDVVMHNHDDPFLKLLNGEGK